MSILNGHGSDFVLLLHAGDTHHGVKPLQSVIDAESVLNPDIISCNQIHHMHFFKTKYLIPNIPLTKITDLPLSKPAPSNSSSIKPWSIFPGSKQWHS